MALAALLLALVGLLALTRWVGRWLLGDVPAPGPRALAPPGLTYRAAAPLEGQLREPVGCPDPTCRRESAPNNFDLAGHVGLSRSPLPSRIDLP